jgi:glutathione S-transferase
MRARRIEMKLYTHALSPFSAKVRIVLREKGLPFDDEQLPISRNAILSKPERLLAANPRGQVPTLFDEDLVLYDSTVILEYLEERAPAPALLPVGAKARARARLLEDDADWLMNGAIVDLLAETYRKPDPATRDERKLADSAKAIRSAYSRLEHVLKDGRPHLCGEPFTLSDVSWLLPVSFAAAFGVPPGEGVPSLGAWLARVAARPSVAAETKAMREALAKLPD